MAAANARPTARGGRLDHFVRREGLERLSAATTKLYGAEAAARLVRQVAELPRIGAPEGGSRGCDVIVVAYPDHVTEPCVSPLRTLGETLANHLPRELPYALHLLPPYLSDGDDGFAVVDHCAIDERYGSLSDLQGVVPAGVALDFVLNHVSASHKWFREYLATGENAALFHTFADHQQVSWGTTVRQHDILQPFEANGSRQWVWCTYGRGQVDLNYRSPETFARSVEILSTLAARDPTLLRLDALPHAWKSPGGGPNSRESVDLMAAWHSVLEVINPAVRVWAEADFEMGYVQEVDGVMANHLEFPSLILAATVLGAVGPLAEWITRRGSCRDEKLGLTTVMSHDGVHLRPMRPPLSPDLSAQLRARLEQNPGVHFRDSLIDGKRAAYEINGPLRAVFADAKGFDAERYISSQALLLASPGCPQVFLPTLFALPSEAVRRADPRAAIRARWQRADLDRHVEDGGGVISQALTRLMLARTGAIARGGRTFGARFVDRQVLLLKIGGDEVIFNGSGQVVRFNPATERWYEAVQGAYGRGPVGVPTGGSRWFSESSSRADRRQEPQRGDRVAEESGRRA